MPTPGTPVIRNIDDIKGPVKGLEFVHFADAQWMRATKGIPVGRKLPKRGLTIECTKSQHGGMLLMARCGGAPGEVCITQLVWKDGRLVYQCSCTKLGGDGRPPPEGCKLVIRRTPVIGFGCEAETCTGTCRFQIILSGGRLYLHCRCQ